MEYVGKHRLTHDFANSTGVRFMTINGELLCTGSDPTTIASVGRQLDVGDTFD
ncbi:hypothetical protein FGG33_gp11 [Mycobacterium phage Benedict]|uniref:Uncharacterized protein n=1 Tax=Mycobacterium phage Benedict TaxID=2902890 RepID=G1EDN3_9CAUD|nr:hypothetical protein FGG33_gp11 [Mycobacterium phage Benedict]AEJ93431.1 hypothetical protein BENEDICT_86 [Mycobacterium phage Benedict]AEJ93521.1 hypothetical protein AIRMID_85 [Mycobacterium phage Airmid]AVR77033.1 hypothetical protein SEA_JABIRU_83 [Mycobacterium phage Jabiru]